MHLRAAAHSLCILMVQLDIAESNGYINVFLLTVAALSQPEYCNFALLQSENTWELRELHCKIEERNTFFIMFESHIIMRALEGVSWITR